MSDRYTLTNLAGVEDAAPAAGFGDVQEARFATRKLEARETGLSLHRLKPGKRQAFGHRHVHAEEVYIVLAGSGRAKLDDEIVELAPRDALRVSPPVTRAFEAGDEGLELLAVGPRHDGDGDLVHGWWADR